MSLDERAIVEKQLYDAIREVPDWPRPGINFKDASQVYSDPFNLAAAALAIGLAARDLGDVPNARYFLVPESRGIILGSIMASGMQMGLAIARKPGKSPPEFHHAEYALEYGTDRLELPTDALPEGSNVLIYDDLLATGGTAEACHELVHMSGCSIVGFLFLMELTFLDGRAKLEDRFGKPVSSALHFAA